MNSFNNFKQSICPSNTCKHTLACLFVNNCEKVYFHEKWKLTFSQHWSEQAQGSVQFDYKHCFSLFLSFLLSEALTYLYILYYKKYYPMVLYDENWFYFGPPKKKIVTLAGPQVAMSKKRLNKVYKMYIHENICICHRIKLWIGEYLS